METGNFENVQVSGHHAHVGYRELFGPVEHARDDLAFEARRVESPFAGDREQRTLERAFELERLGDDIETGREARADRGEPARESAGRALLAPFCGP